MRVLVQRSLNSSVEVDKKCVGSIDKGLVLLVGFTDGDSEKEIDFLINKIINLRIFDDENGNLSTEYSSDSFHVFGKDYTTWADWLCTKAIVVE